MQKAVPHTVQTHHIINWTGLGELDWFLRFEGHRLSCSDDTIYTRRCFEANVTLRSPFYDINRLSSVRNVVAPYADNILHHLIDWDSVSLY